MSKYDELCWMKQAGIRVPRFIYFNKELINIKNISDAILYWFDGNVSIRSSGSISTPGRMQTVLHVTTDKIKEAFNKVKNSLTSESVTNYLKARNIDNFDYGIIIQEMITVKNEKDCSGVLTTIHPVTQNKELYGNVVFGKQGDILMSGRTKAYSLDDLKFKDECGYESLMKQVRKINRLYYDTPREIEFTIIDSTAYILQSRDFLTVDAPKVQLEVDQTNVIGQGRSATPFNTRGIITFNKENSEGKILISPTTDFEDTDILINCKGVITLQGGSLSHAAIIAREFKIPCIVSAGFTTVVEEGMEVILHNNGDIELVP